MSDVGTCPKMFHPDGHGDCIEKFCAHWDKEQNMCCERLAGQSLFRIAESLEKINWLMDQGLNVNARTE